MKKITALIGSCLFFFIVMTMYLILDQFSTGIDHDAFARESKKVQDRVANIKSELKSLEGNLDLSDRAIDTMQQKIDDLNRKIAKQTNQVTNLSKEEKQSLPIQSRKKDIATKVIQKETKGTFLAEKKDDIDGKADMCLFSDAPSGNTADIKMLDMFDKWKFDNPDGGAWKQGWDVRYKADAFDKEELLVIVMPHSHNDPGWIKTYEQYYRDQTNRILNNVVDALVKDERRKFIWAEISYFSMWWKDASQMQREHAKEQIKRGQLEIVTGGWVMNDEANPHYFNMLDQLIEGHQWLENNLGVKPKHGWAIDPFGYTPTMAYLLKRMDFDGMLIQRVHYHVKKHLASNQNLEFMWRQNWDHGKTTDMFCHVMPFYSYDVPHTCGPDPKICCQFDFRRLPGGRVMCPWHVPPQEINSGNVRVRSQMLLDQYKKKAQLYKTNVVLAPLGDDFRYEIPFETQQQYGNYERIMEHVNSHPEYKAKIQFGTLKDFFQAVFQRSGLDPSSGQTSVFPSLGGDFFTYADRDNHYWSGYYTSRSFMKHMDRELVGYLRGAEILYSLATSYSKHHGRKFPSDDLYSKLVYSRQQLALFQHHDGITGTAKDHVVVDYGNRMLNAVRDSSHIMQTAASYLMSTDQQNFEEKRAGEPILKIDESRRSWDSMSLKSTLIISADPRLVVFYNSLAQQRQKTVYLYVSELNVEVLDMNNAVVPHQISMVWKSVHETDKTKYELSFVVTIPALGLARYQVKRAADSADALASYQVMNIPEIKDANTAFSVSMDKVASIKLQNNFLSAEFDGATGCLTDLVRNKKSTKMQIRFMTYGTVGASDRSGAYLFLPDGSAKSIPLSSVPVTIVRGKIYSEVRTSIQYVVHSVRIHHSNSPEAKALDIRNEVDIRSTRNVELVMRVESGVKNKDREFFTDLNGFQMQRRKTLAKLPLQANFYPAPSMIFLQDTEKRLTLQTQQANGVASLEQGYLEVVMDRRLMQDDNRGLGQGVTDNKLTPSNFRLLLEYFETKPVEVSNPSPTAYPSLLSVKLSNGLMYPIFKFLALPTLPVNTLQPFKLGLSESFPADYHVVNMKSLQQKSELVPSDTVALILHRMGYDCHFETKCKQMKITYSNMFDSIVVKDVETVSLSLMNSKKKLVPTETMHVEPMELQAYKLKFR